MSEPKDTPPHVPFDGRSPIERAGFSYLPRYIPADHASQLTDYFSRLHPLRERRHPQGEHHRVGRSNGQLTRPVVWLGAWQFASLGYYAEPDHRVDRCLRAEPIPKTLRDPLAGLSSHLQRNHAIVPSARHAPFSSLPNTCLINYYGSQVGSGPPVDRARLRMHRDGEPGPVVMFNFGQPGLLEFVDPQRSDRPVLSVWTRHRSAVIFSGPEFKDRLYHRIQKVRFGKDPVLVSPLDGFSLRRVSVSFRHVPESLILDLDQFSEPARAAVLPYVTELAKKSQHFEAQLRLARRLTGDASPDEAFGKTLG